jgi:hypothetical protein
LAASLQANNESNSPAAYVLGQCQMLCCAVLMPQAVSVQASNIVDLLRAKLHAACNEFYAAVHDGDMHGLEKASR